MSGEIPAQPPVDPGAGDDQVQSAEDVARTWLAEEAVDAEKAAKAEKKLEEAAAAASSSSSSAPGEAAPPAPDAAKEETKSVDASEEVSALAWTVIDLLAVKLLGPHVKLTPEDFATLLPVTVPVVRKHLPDAEVPIELVLLGTAALVYAPKLTADAPPAAPAAAATEKPAEKEVNAPPAPTIKPNSRSKAIGVIT